MIDRLFIAARAPRPGFTKTRLGRVVGHHAAATIYRGFLTDLARRFAGASFDTGWYITPSDAWPEILPCIPRGKSASLVVTQPEGDWTTRQRALFDGMADRGEARTILIASDSPHLPLECVTCAFDVLAERDLVFGPVQDGGYYLIGMRTPRAAAILDGVLMSTADVLRSLTDRATLLGLSVGEVDATFDIDEVQDLEQLQAEVIRRSDLEATRRSLSRAGLLRNEPIPVALAAAMGDDR
jgi:rSAM/selenodomain-associated transferase 1